MTTIEKSIFINASPEDITAISLDGSRLPEWYVGIERAYPDELYPEPGGAVDLVYKAAGITFELKMTMLELDYGHYSSYKMEGMITGTNRWVYTPEGDGTWITATFDYDMPGGILGQIANRLMVERMNADNLEKSLNNLKQLAEGW
jgi:hypothetical protein